MDKLHFITSEGIRGLTIEWNPNEAGVKYDAAGWLEKFGTRIGSGTAPFPSGDGWVDMSGFAAVYSPGCGRTDDQPE